MDRKATYPVTALSIIILAIMCSVVSAQNNAASTVPPSNTTLPPTAAPNSCNLTSSKPSPTQQTHVFHTCMVAKFAAYLSLGSNKYIELKNGVVSNSSTCGSDATNSTVNPKLIIDFNCSQFEFEFEELANKTQVAVKAINGKYLLDSEKKFTNSTQSFKTSDKGHYYKCNAEQAIIGGTNGNDTVQLILSNFAFEAYRDTSGTDFYRVPEECALDSSEVSDLVRIGVGICLVAVVALVLVAYFVGRRRWAERSSYESV